MKTRVKRQESRPLGGSPYLGELVKDSFMHIYTHTYIFWLHWRMGASLVAGRGLVAPRHVGSKFPKLGIEPASSALEGGFLTTGPPGKCLRMTSLKKYYLSWGHKDISEQLCKHQLEKERQVWDPCPSSCSEYWVNHESWQCATARRIPKARSIIDGSCQNHQMYLSYFLALYFNL